LAKVPYAYSFYPRRQAFIDVAASSVPAGGDDRAVGDDASPAAD